MIVAAAAVLAAIVVGSADEGGSPSGGRGADVEGTVTYSGPLPDPVSISEAGTVRHPIVRDAEDNGLEDAVVWIEGASSGGFRDETEKLAPATMDQQNYEFIPHVLAVRAGQEVEFLNSDVANHGVTASSLEEKNRFNVVTPAGGRIEHTFVASRHPVAIGCPIHASMSGWVYVFDHPFFAVTDDRGRFRLTKVPPGEYTLHVRHGDGGMVHKQPLVVRETGPPGGLRIEFTGADLKARRGRVGAR
jgi:plastocyanin